MANECKVIFWDVQHGHATYIRTPNGRHIVIDLGTGNYSTQNIMFSPLRCLRDTLGVAQLDHVTITHPHLDHIDDIMAFDELNPKSFTRPKHLTNSEVMQGVNNNHREKFQKYCDINNRYNFPIPTGSFEELANPMNWGGVKMKSFHPSHCSHSNFNNHSILTVITYEGIKVVIPGDNETCSFDEMFLMPEFRDYVGNADVLLAPHHGRNSGFNTEFINLVNPRITIVSDGRYCDSSANSRYSVKSRGWNVENKKTGQWVKRRCLTTNSDGEVVVSFGPSSGHQFKNFLNVSIGHEIK